MSTEPFVVRSFLNRAGFARTLIDTGCLCYGVINESVVRRLNLQRVKIRPREVKGVNGKPLIIDEAVRLMSLDIDGHREEGSYVYILPYTLDFDMILGAPWMKRWNITVDTAQEKLEFGNVRHTVPNSLKQGSSSYDHLLISAVAYASHLRRSRREPPGTGFYC